MTYLIIGASSGYGKAIADSLSLNYTVLTAQRTAADIIHDATDAASWQRLEKEIQNKGLRIDGIVFSAGIAADIQPIGTKDLITANKVLMTNVQGLYHALDMSARLLTEGGVFINIGSIAYRKNYYGGAEYCASKAAQLTLVRTARIEGLKRGVRYCSLNPGLGQTNFQTTRFGGDANRAAQLTEGLRILDPTDVAQAVLFILSVPLMSAFLNSKLPPHNKQNTARILGNIRKIL